MSETYHVKRSNVRIKRFEKMCYICRNFLKTIFYDRAGGTKIFLETLKHFFMINQAQIQYEEYASILINSQFGSTTSTLFRALQKNTSGLNISSLETLWSAASFQRRPNQQQPDNIVDLAMVDAIGADPREVKGPGTFDRFSRRQFPTRRKLEDVLDNHSNS